MLNEEKTRDGEDRAVDGKDRAADSKDRAADGEDRAIDDATLLDKRRAYQGKVVQLDVEHVRLPGGVSCELEIIRHQGAAAVVPVDASGDIVLVRQYRHATGGWLLEVPAGKLDPGEDPETCAFRELEEETGLKAGRLESLGWIWTTPGFADERIWLYLARDLTSGQQCLEPDELLSLETFPLEVAQRMALDGEITDSKTAIAILRAIAAVGAS